MLKISISPWVHGTPWLGKKITKSIHTPKENPYLEEVWAIKSFHELKTAAQNWGQWSKLKRIVASFEEFKNQLIQNHGMSEDIDPVKFLIYLYFHEELSLNDILLRLNSNGFNYKDESGLRRLLKQSLKWKLRDKSEKTTHGKKRISKTTSQNEQQKRDICMGNFLSWFIQNSQNIQLSDFDTSKYQECKNKTEKILFLFEIYFWIKKDWFEKLVSLDVSHRLLAELIEEKINKIQKTNPVDLKITKITKSDIDRLLLSIQK